MKRAQTNNLKKKPSKFLGIPAAILTVATFTATISGTFAWFNYSTRAYVTYQGVSVGDFEKIEVGIRSKFMDEQVARLYKSVETMEDGSYIYWADRNLTPEMVNGVIKHDGSATNVLNPVTSGAYTGGNFVLYDTPRYCKNNISPEFKAKKDQYCTIPFVFRVENLEPGQEGTYVPAKSIYLSGAELKCDTEIDKSVRMFANNGSNQFLIHPGQKTDGSTKVGGVLNINPDHFYDYFTDEETGEIYEFAYGEFENEVEYKDEKNSGSPEVDPKDITSFLANHIEGSHSLKDSCKPKEVLYKGMSNFRKGFTPITATTGDKNYANLDLTIYSEGWDLSVIDKEKGSQFNLDLKFEIVL